MLFRSKVLGGGQPTAEDVPCLKYTEMVLLESMRLYPPAYIIGRQPIEDCVIGGYRVPAGRTIWMSQCRKTQRSATSICM